jgi:hypothetical protein
MMDQQHLPVLNDENSHREINLLVYVRHAAGNVEARERKVKCKPARRAVSALGPTALAVVFAILKAWMRARSLSDFFRGKFHWD